MDRAEQQKFRSRTAGFIWAMIEARRKQEPGFISEEDLQRWNENKQPLERFACDAILRRAERLHQGLLQTDSLASIPAPENSTDEEQLDVLIDLVMDFIVGDLREAAQLAGRGGEINWDAIANWDNLGQIRDGLDQLPDIQESTLEDGPLPPDSFVWNGVRHGGLRLLVFRLISTLWHANNQVLSFEDLAEPVWQDRNAFVDGGTIGRPRTDANSFFEQNEIPLRVRTHSAQAQLIEIGD